MPGRLRFGVVGTGPWASQAHVPAAQSSDRVDLVAVYGRDASRAASVAAGTSAQPFTDYDAFLAEVDAVGFAVPPDVQAPLAERAIRAGKHVLLDKPVALDAGTAAGLAELARERGIRSLVFFTHRFSPAWAAWLAEVRENGPWLLGRVESFGSVLVDETGAFFDSPWRHARGGLWDVGPHGVAQLCGVLGRVTTVFAERGTGDLISLVLHHASGGQGSITLALDLPEPVRGGTWFAGVKGRMDPPSSGDWGGTAIEAYQAALAQLADEALEGASAHECDLGFGAHVTAVLAAAERSAASGRVERV